MAKATAPTIQRLAATATITVEMQDLTDLENFKITVSDFADSLEGHHITAKMVIYQNQEINLLS